MLVKPPMLSLETSYAVILIAKFCGNIGYEKYTQFYPLHTRFYLQYENEKIEILSAEWRDKEWMEIELCQFINYTDNAKFNFPLHWEPRDYHLYVEGVEFRPIDMDIGKEQCNVEEYRSWLVDDPYITLEKEDFEILPAWIFDDIETPDTGKGKTHVEESNADQEKLLSTDFEKIIIISKNDLHFTTAEEVSEAIPMKMSHDIETTYVDKWVDKSDRKKSVGLARSLHAGKDKKDTRFPQKSIVSLHECGCKIKSHMLSNKTVYAAWLLFKGDLYNSIARAYLTLGHQVEETRRVYLADSSKTILPLTESEDHRVLTLPFGRMEVDRRHGWFEVELFPFFNDMDVRDEVAIRLQIRYATGITIRCIEFRPQGFRPKFF